MTRNLVLLGVTLRRSWKELQRTTALWGKKFFHVNTDLSGDMVRGINNGSISVEHKAVSSLELQCRKLLELRAILTVQQKPRKNIQNDWCTAGSAWFLMTPVCYSSRIHRWTSTLAVFGHHRLLTAGCREQL